MAYTEFYIRTTGNACNAGSTNTDAATVTSTNGGWSTTTNIFTAASGTPFSDVNVGDWASITTDAATSTSFNARITAVNGGGASITLSTTAKSGTAPTTLASGMTCRVGGAWATIGGVGAWFVGTSTNANGDFPRINLSGTYTYSAAQTISSAGTGIVTWEGYTSSPGDGGVAIINGGTSGASYNVINLSGQNHAFRNLWCKNNGATGNVQWFQINNSSGRNVFHRVTVSNCRGNAFRVQAGNNVFVECEAFSFNAGNVAGGAGFNIAGASALVRCWSYSSSTSNSSGFNIAASGVSLHSCIAWNNTGSSGGGVTMSVQGSFNIQNCVFYANRIGVIISNSSLPANGIIENCIFENNTTWAIQGAHKGQMGLVNNCAYYNNGGGAHLDTTNSVKWIEMGGIDLAASSLSDPANGDFTPTRTEVLGAGRGNFLKNGSSSSTPLSYPDIGAINPALVDANTIAAAIWSYEQRSLT